MGSPLAASSVSYTGTDLVPSTFYTYRIRTTGTTGSSAWLVGDEIKSAPPAPTTLVVGTTSSSAIAVSWTDNSADETGFEVQKCSGSGCDKFVAVGLSPLAANALSHNESGLNGATTYRLRVRAVRTGVTSSWLTSGNITTAAAPASCSAPTTVVVDRGQKGTVTSVGRGLHSDTKMIPGTRQPVTAYYDGSATGGTAQVKLSWWSGSTFRVESVAGDSRVAVGSATSVRLAFLSNGRPMVFWTTASTTVKAAMRSAPLTSAGTWSAAVIDTVSGGLNRSLEVSVSPLDHVGLIYLTNSAVGGRARFIYCSAGCSSLAGFTAMTAGTDTIEASNIIANYAATGIGWCKHDASTYYPAVVYPGNAGAATRYSSCLSGSLSSCRTVTGWSGQATTVVATAGVGARLLIDSNVIGDPPKIISKNAANTALQAFQMNQACNAAPGYTFAAGNSFGGATTANSWLSLLKSSDGIFHVLANFGTTLVHHHNSSSTNFLTATWNAAGVVDTVTLPAVGLGVGGADFNSFDNQIYVSYGAAAAPFNINLGVVADTTVASSSASAVYYRHLPDMSGGIQLPLATGQTRNVSNAATSDGRPAVVYVDNSVGSATGAQLKYSIRDGLTSSKSWVSNLIPNTTAPLFPALAFDHNNKPWISYYDSGLFRYFLVTNSATDGSGDWSIYQFPINAKTASGTSPATDDTSVAMLYSGATAKPVMVVINSTAAGGAGVRAALFDPSIASFTSLATLDSLGASFATRLSTDFNKSGSLVVAYHDLTTTRVKFNYTTNGITWLATPPQVSSVGTGREGLQIRLNPSSGRPAVSYFDRANNSVFYATCNTAIDSCASGANWAAPASVASAAGVSGIVVGNEQLLNTSLSFSSTGTPFIVYPTGIAASEQTLGVADNSGGSFVATTLSSAATSTVAGAGTANYAMTGFSADSVRTALGTLSTNYVGPNNWLYATSCGD